MPKPHVSRKTPYGIMVVRAAYGECVICKKPVYQFTPATPKWQRGNKLIHKLMKWIKS